MKIKEQHLINTIRELSDTIANYKMVIFILCLVVILSVTGMVIGLNESNEKHKLGDMVCEEQGLGEFKEFDSKNKVISCYEIDEQIPFDGGNIKVVKRGG